ncbi:hypothetical protein GCM10009540_87970 [Streptomyces turgidiscabies]
MGVGAGAGAGVGGSGAAGGTAVFVGDIGGADEWCVAGMTAPVRVNVGGRMDVGRVSCLLCLAAVICAVFCAVYLGRVPGEPSHPIRVGNPALC